MQIPQFFIDKIKRIFGQRGEEWIENFPNLLNQCIQKWSLTNCEVFEHSSMNLIIFAQSPAYGAVALKVGVPHKELFTEMKTLALFNGRYACKCYDCDTELGASLLERVIPGCNLWSVSDRQTQLNVGTELIAKLAIPVAGDHGLPTYEEWVRRAFADTRSIVGVGDKLLSYMEAAEQVFWEIYTPERPKVLLHGDFHHANMVYSEKDGWIAIDPQGVIGVQCLESARFIQNHLDYQVNREEMVRCMDEAVDAFSASLGESRRTIAICVFVLQVLSTCWGMEMNYEEESLRQQLSQCEFFLEYLHGV